MPDLTESADGSDVRARGVLLAILGVAAGLRVWGVLTHTFFQDELYTLRDVHRLLEGPLLEVIAGARPLYFLLQAAILPVLPENELGLRILPLLFGIGGVYLTWAIADELFGSRAAVIAALLAAISPWHLFISELARYWSLVYLLVCLFLLARAKVEGGEGESVWRWGGLGALLLGTMTHPTFLFPLAGVFLFDAVSAWRKHGLKGVLRMPAMRHIWLPFAGFVAVAALVLVLTGDAAAALARPRASLAFLFRLIPAVVQWMSPAVFAGGVLAVGALAVWGRNRERWWGGAASMGLASSLVLLVGFGSFTQVYAIYATGLLPLVFVSIGGLVTAFSADSVRSRAVQWMTLAVLLAALSPASVSHVLDGTRFDPRPAFAFIREEAPELPVYTTSIALQEWYADDLEGRDLDRLPLASDPADAPSSSYWVVAPVRRRGIVYDEDGELRRWLETQCRQRLAYESTRVDYRQYRIEVHLCTQAGATSRDH